MEGNNEYGAIYLLFVWWKGEQYLFYRIRFRLLCYMQLGRYQESIDTFVELGVAQESSPELQADPNCIQYNIAWNFAHMELFGEAIELFERVDVKSLSGPDASLWLDELTRNNSQNEKTILSKDLPGFCKDSISSEVQSQSVQ